MLMTGPNPPPDYRTPSFPSLYWLINAKADEPQYLYHMVDVWRFTLFWTLLIYGTCHITVSCYALLMQWRSWKVMWAVPLVYGLVAALEAVLAGSVVGLM